MLNYIKRIFSPAPGILSGPELLRASEAGIIRGVRPEAINAQSIDLHLGNEFIVEKRPAPGTEKVPVRFTQGARRGPESLKTYVYGKVILGPGQSCLATTREEVCLPDNMCGSIVLKSTAARFMLGHKLAGHCDGGFRGQITLEFTNESKYETMELFADDSVAQLILHRTSPAGEFAYDRKKTSKYVGQSGVTPGRDL